MKALGFLLALGLVTSPGRIINFDSGTLGRMPSGWTAPAAAGGAARWEVMRDLSAPTQPYVLAQLSSYDSANRFPLAILDGSNLRDGEVSVRLKPVSGTLEESGGVVFRYRDANNYYVAETDARRREVALYRVENGQRFPIGAAVKHDLPPNAWRILKISVSGPHIQVYVDHRRILTAADNGYTGAGKVGLATARDSVTYFDDFRVYPK
ncbi:MAG TPA: hypothetical protein VMU19_02655 [Bryobacteraceae bacterium]|nr:hypothetical protein [Bryobacteraceae bacterium]